MKANNKRKVFGDAVDLLMDDIEERAMTDFDRRLKDEHTYHDYQ